MAYVEEIDEKFFVIKCEDTVEFLDTKDRYEILRILNKITQARHNSGRNVNDYVVINLDEPYMEEIKEVMVRHGDWG